MINLKVIAESGQCFRMREIFPAPGQSMVYFVQSRDKGVFVRQAPDSQQIDFVGANSREVENIWKPYFDMGTDYQPFYDAIEQSDDEFLKSALEYSRGMRILRQDFWETLVSFLISQNSNIPKIKTAIEALCERFGISSKAGAFSDYTFPTKEMLGAQVQKFEDLDGLGLGYRQKYLYSLIKADSSEVVPEYDKLLRLDGVGPKVASCVMLYGAHDLTQFPMDTWMKKIVSEMYGGKFDTTPYAGFEGFVQQIMYYYYRHLKGK